MSQNPNLSKYFNDGSPGPSTELFEKITIDEKVSDSYNTEINVSGDYMLNPIDKNVEPVVCKIFQGSNTKNTLQVDPGSFFDMIGSPENQLSQSFPDEDSVPHPCKEVGDFRSSFKRFDENCPKLPRVSEIERSRDAWIIPNSARTVLIEMVTSPPGVYVPERENLTMPGVILEKELKDTVNEAVHHYIGKNEAIQRKILTAAEVTQDDRGIRDLIQAGCYRAAVNLTKDLLTMYGQGAGRAGHPSKHTVHSIQLWFTRLSLLVKLRSFSVAHAESQLFGDLDKPDMFFQFYPELYGGRTGTIVPFSLRVLIAQIPAYIDNHHLALTRLHGILTVVRKILSNLNMGLFEDGTPSEMSLEARQESIQLWTDRETRVLHAIVGCSLSFKDYSLAIEIVQMLIAREHDSQQKKCLQSALGRILLQLGDLVSAEKQFALARTGLSAMGPRDIIDSGLCLLAHNQFEEAYNCFARASDLDPKNITAINNMSVCLLYLGKLKQAVLLLEQAIQRNPKMALHESLLLNLCTLYELQGSFYSRAQLKLLELVYENKGDGFNIGCLKLQM